MSFDLAESERLHDKVCSSAPIAENNHLFAELIDEIITFQVKHNPLAQRAYQDFGRRPTLELAGVPVDAFKLRRVATHPTHLDVALFRTSGTTQGQARGCHSFRTLSTYHALSVAWARQELWTSSSSANVVALLPSSKEVPDSSLSHMVDHFAEVFGCKISHHIGPNGVDLSSLCDALSQAARVAEPVLLVGTAFAFVHVIDAGVSLPALPAGSRIMITGGTKGRSREVHETELRREISRAFAVERHAVIGEYGMTELTSQLYDRGGEARVYRAPPWMRVIATDPVTGDNLPEGQEGILKFADLGNIDSAALVQTLDLGCVKQQDVTLRGRLAGAEARGCSLLIEELTARGGGEL